MKVAHGRKNVELERWLGVLKFSYAVILIKSEKSSALARWFKAAEINVDIKIEDKNDGCSAIEISRRANPKGEVDILFNWDIPEDFDSYLHRLSSVRRFGSEGLCITFVSDG